MAMPKHEEQNPSSSLLDALYCEEEQWEDAEEEEEEEEEDEDVQEDEIRERNSPSFLRPILLLEQDLFWEDEELLTLFSKEKQGGIPKKGSFDVSLSSARKEAVEWILKVNAHFGFCTLTSVLAVNYFDRFISSFHFHNDKPWMFQLAAVTCLSLAAKVEETYVPLLLDLQVEGTKYVFEAKTIQKMELLVLSTLEWKMNPVTPLSFLDHIIRRLGLKNHLHWEFLRRCESLLLSLLTDWRLVSYVPSLLATATMMHVIDQIEACNPLDYQNQLLGVLNISKEKVKDCYRLIVEKSGSNPSGKRKREEMINNGMDLIPNSPNGVVESCYYYDYLSSNSDSSSDSWIIENSSSRKKGRTMSLHEQEQEKQQQQQQPLPLQLPSLSRVFVNIIGSPR